MKLDAMSYSEVKKPHGKNPCAKGRLLLRCSAPCALYVTIDGRETLAGYAAAHDVEIPAAATFTVTGPDGLRVFQRVEKPASFVDLGEKYTNIDRLPDESGSVLEVKRALRSMELQRRAILDDIRAEREKLKREKVERRKREVVDPETGEVTLAPPQDVADDAAPDDGGAE